MTCVGFDEADWILAIANGTLNPTWEAMKKTLMEEGACVQQITVTQKNGRPRTNILRLCRSVTFTAANFVPGQDSKAGDNDEGGIRGGGAIADRCTLIKIPKPSLVDRADGGGRSSRPRRRPTRCPPRRR